MSANSSDPCFKVPIPLTINSTGIALDFWLGVFFRSHALSTRVTLYPVSKHTELLRLPLVGASTSSDIIIAVAKLYPLKMSPELGANSFATDLIISQIDSRMTVSDFVDTS